ncbi:E3 ubiquitin-protein ligase parkin-like isoform X2 [Physella acuta]|nr:E3 ubiquitin-protein ligase parkin-like isoform X2 [Physella acuta]
MALNSTSVTTLGLEATLEQSIDELMLVIKFSDGKKYTVNICSEKTVKDLKEIVAQKAEVIPRTINLVFAGHLLSDSTILQDCGLGAYTTLHAFSWCEDGLDCPVETTVKARGSSEGQCGLQQFKQGSLPIRNSKGERPEVVGFDGESNVDGNHLASASHSREVTRGLKPRLGHNVPCTEEQSRFFVYCKLCDCVRPAKLRVSCKKCGNGVFLVDRGPSNWDDISPSTNIKGNCKSPNCTSDTPRFYLRCIQSHEGNLEGTTVALKHVQANRRRVECIICRDLMSHVLIFPCVPGHVICLECFRQYCSTCLNDRRFVEHPVHGYTLPCPVGCENSHIEETHHFLLMGQEKYERYKNFGAEEYVIQNGGILCPSPGCGMGLFPSGENKLIKCRECQFMFCKECRREYHAGDCEEYLESLQLNLSNLGINDEMAARASWERESQSLIEETTKSCPGCQTKTERSGGCMHMVCTRCKTEWCWICCKPWNRECQADHWFGT